ncbi:MAG: helix-turn-helix domain-containing protein [Vitreoscilla sp.]
MPNIATVLKSEITRLARKELRTETEGLRRTLTACRSEISALKKVVRALQADLRRLEGAGRRRPAPPAAADEAEEDGGKLRFRAQGMARNRERLGLSAADFGLLVGASGQSIYAWESGKAKPRRQNLAAIAALRGLGKREVTAKLEALKAG